MIPPQVNGATSNSKHAVGLIPRMFPMIPPQVNGATLAKKGWDTYGNAVSNDSAPS